MLKQHFPAKLLPGHTGAGKTNPSCSIPQPGCLREPSGPRPEGTGLGRGDAASSRDGRDGHNAYGKPICIPAPERPVSPGSMQQAQLGAALPAAATCQPPAPTAGRAPHPSPGVSPAKPTRLAGLLHRGDLAARALRDDFHGVVGLLARPTCCQLLWDHCVRIWGGEGGDGEKPRVNLDGSSSLPHLKNNCPQNPSQPPPTGHKGEAGAMGAAESNRARLSCFRACGKQLPTLIPSAFMFFELPCVGWGKFLARAVGETGREGSLPRLQHCFFCLL